MKNLIDNDTTIDFNITNYCNSNCPTCKRFSLEPGPLRLMENLELLHMDVDFFRKYLSQNSSFFLNKNCQFCGEFGDPLAHPKLIDLISISSKYFKSISINTNGGFNRKGVFTEIIEKYIKTKIFFSIDGLNDEINSMYRYGVNTKIAISNMLNFAQKTRGRTYWDYIIFRHNIHQLEDAIKISVENNIVLNIKINVSERKDKGVYKVSYENLEEVKSIYEKYKSDIKYKYKIVLSI